MMVGQNPAKLLAQVSNPLIFFAVGLLLIEGIIGLVVIPNSQLSADHQFYVVVLMIIVFLIVILVVAGITVWRPRNLYKDMMPLKEFIDSDGFQDAVVDIITTRVKPECLSQQEESP